MKLRWHDASMVWDPAMYGDVDHVMASYKEVWVPELILTNSAVESDTLGKNWQRDYFHNTGSWRSNQKYMQNKCVQISI